MDTNAANRLDRLPIFSWHKVTTVAVAFAYFYEFADINTFSSVAPRLLKAWGASVNEIALVNSTSFFGMFLGATAAGWMADRIGRLRSLMLTTLWFSLFSALSALSWNMLSMGVFRVLTSAGLAAMTVVAGIYMNEMFPGRVRGKYMAYAMVIGICGTPATQLLASWLVPLNDWSWRLLFIWGALGILFLLFLRHLKESPRWLENRGRFDEAERILSDIEARATKEVGALPQPAAPVPTPPVAKMPLTILLEKRYLRPTLLLTVLWVTQTIGFFGYASWAPTLLAKQGFSIGDSIFFVALTTVGAPLGSYVASLVTDRFERKWCLVVFGLLIAVAGLLYGLTFNPVFIVLFGFIVNLFERGYTALAYAYSPELFDIRGRSMGTSVSYGLGRLSNAAGPLIIAALYTSYGYTTVFYFIAGTWTLGAVVLALFAPKTKVHTAPAKEDAITAQAGTSTS